MDDLKPCPFCGADPVLDGEGDEAWVVCFSCNVRIVGVFGCAREKAIAAWNKRPSASTGKGEPPPGWVGEDGK